MRYVSTAACLTWIGLFNAFAQSNGPIATVVSAGYSPPAGSVQGAPGQVISFMAYGLDYALQNPAVASGSPLPTDLAGISVSLQQGSLAIPLPILSVQQLPCAPFSLPNFCPVLTIISAQIPFEVQPDCPACGRIQLPAYLIVSENGANRGAVLLNLPSDNIHIADPCDTTAVASYTGGATCGKSVAHADGNPVTSLNPAKAGEELVMYALGLGPQTDPPLKTGIQTPSPAPRFQAGASFGLNFDFEPNASPTRPRPIPNSSVFSQSAPPLYLGPVVGFVGLYQANFVIPEIPAGSTPLTPCSALGVQSNLTVTLYGPLSFDGAGICVQP